MTNSAVLELTSLETRHPPIGAAFLQQCACPCLVRLRIDPTAFPQGTMAKEVEVRWRRRPGKQTIVTLTREIGWSGLDYLELACEQLSIASNKEDITAGAAIGIAALLIHELESCVLQNVLPIGSGGDYLVQVVGDARTFQLEVSGVTQDVMEGETRSRLSKKSAQVLKEARTGFVSVTTFSHGSTATFLSALHFVRREGKRTSTRRK